MADIREDHSEVLHYDDPDFQVYFRKNFIPANCELTDISIHWHDELEFVYVISGETNYRVNNSSMVIGAGQGIFVNSRQMHLIISADQDCELYCLIFHPMLFSASPRIYEKYIRPVIENREVPFLLLTQEKDWEKSILQKIEGIGFFPNQNGRELKIMELLLQLWECLYEDVKNTQNVEPERDTDYRELAVAKKMIAFIYNNYAGKMSLQDICDVGNVGKTKCTAVFKEYVNMTPVDFLNRYRVEKSTNLLLKTDYSVTEIAYEVGFSDASYYTKTFKKILKKSPLQYRLSGGRE